MRTPCLALLTAALLAPMAACTDDHTDTDADYQSATSAQRKRALRAAAGGDINMLAATVFLGFDGGPLACPRVTRSATERVITGGCTNDDWTYQGSIRVRNLAPDAPPPPEGSPRYEAYEISFQDFDAIRADRHAHVDGVTRFAEGPAEDVVTADLSALIDGIEARSVGTWRHRAQGATVTADEGSYIDVTGLGAGAIEGTWSISREAESGTIGLRGASLMKLDFAPRTAPCWPVTIDGKEVEQVCDVGDLGG